MIGKHTSMLGHECEEQKIKHSYSGQNKQDAMYFISMPQVHMYLSAKTKVVLTLCYGKSKLIGKSTSMIGHICFFLGHTINKTADKCVAISNCYYGLFGSNMFVLTKTSCPNIVL